MKKSTTFTLLILILASWSGKAVMAQTWKADDIIGVWLNEEATGKVEIYKENGKYFGKIVWLLETTDKVTGKPRTDVENPDPKLKPAPLLGLVDLKNFTFNGTDEWSGGTIYDNKNGKTYKSYMKFATPNKLKIRGYIGFSLLGRNTIWTRSIAPQK